MKAIICTKYGPPEVLQLKEVKKPVPKKKEVLIKIHATTVTLGDCEIRSMSFSGFLKFLMRLGIGFKGPRKKFSILGQEFAGLIESIGSEVTRFKIGDSVFGSAGFHFGTYAEYICLSEKKAIALKPENLTYEEAATVPTGGLEAAHFIKEVNIQKGQTILIRGASGSIGTLGIQLAKYYGAEVTAIGNPYSLDIMKNIGADEVIDYTKENLGDKDKKFDYIFDIIGKDSFTRFLSFLKKGGIYLLANPKMSLINHQKREARRDGKKLIYRNMDDNEEQNELLRFLIELIKDGKIKIIIDRRYSLEKMVEAHKYVDEGMKTGSVVITIIQ